MFRRCPTQDPEQMIRNWHLARSSRRPRSNGARGQSKVMLTSLSKDKDADLPDLSKLSMEERSDSVEVDEEAKKEAAKAPAPEAWDAEQGQEKKAAPEGQMQWEPVCPVADTLQTAHSLQLKFAA